jgi:hypothetical protein
MVHRSGFLFAAALLVCQVAIGSDWKLAGQLQNKGKSERLFYDADTFTKTEAGFQFWVKAIPISELDAQIKKQGNALIVRAATKLKSGYVPPFMGLNSIRAKAKTENELRSMVSEGIVDEITANDPSTRRASVLLFEIDCSHQKIRVLDGRNFDAKDNPLPLPETLSQEWRYITPDTNSSRWVELFCTRR